MNASRRIRLAIGTAVASLIAAAIAVNGIATPAAAIGIDIAFDFGTVLPGQVVEQRVAFAVPADATVATVDVGTPIDPAFGTITASVCSPAVGCIPVSALPGQDLPKGDYDLVALLTVSDDLVPGSTALIAGRITIVERAEGLAGTGSTLVPTLGFIAAGVLAIGGIALFIGARRRRAEEETS